MIVVTTQSAQAASTDAAEPRQMYVSAVRHQSPISIFTIVFSWDMHGGTDDERGLVLVKGQEIPATTKVRQELKAVIDVLLDLDEVVFVVLPAQYGSNMLDVGRISLANEDAIMLRVAATLRNFNVSVVNRTVE